jgi:LPXTG-motif cell wall-anchored protein
LAQSNAGGDVMRKLPIIGLVIGVIAAGIAWMKRKKAEPEPEDSETP